MSANLAERPPAQKVPNLPSCFKRTTVGLEIQGVITFKQFMLAFTTLDKTGRGYQWWIGDVLNEGEKRFPEDYAQVIDPIEEEKRENEGKGETFRHYQQVACRIPIRRRRQNLYFGHHQAVAYFDENGQEHWLDLAEREGWSVDKLRKKIKKAREGGAANDPALDLQVLQDPAIRQWLDGYRSVIMNQDDELRDLIKTNDLQGAKFLHRMTLAHTDQVVRQLDRTLAIDCGIVKKAVASMLSATSEVLSKAMRVRGFFMSEADLVDRLTLLVDLGEVKKEKAEALRHEGAKGDVVWEYKAIRSEHVEKDDDDWI